MHIAGQPSGAAAVSRAWQELAHSHLASSLAAAVPVPPLPAPLPAAGVNPPRHTLADLYTHTDRPMFDPAFQGMGIKLNVRVWTPDCAFGKVFSALTDLLGVYLEFYNKTLAQQKHFLQNHTLRRRRQCDRVQLRRYC